MPITYLVHTSMKKTGILVEEKKKLGVQVEGRKVKIRLGDGSSAEYPRDPTQLQIILLFGPTGVSEIHIPPTRGGNNSKEGKPQVLLPTPRPTSKAAMPDKLDGASDSL